MRYLATFSIALLLFVLVDKIALPRLAPLDLFGLATLLLLALPLIDWLIFRQSKRVSPVRVYLVLAMALVVIFWSVYLLSFLPPQLLLALVLGLGALVVIATIVRAPQSRQKREDASLCPECGYDLRATEDRCPECNTPIPQSLRRRRRAAEQIAALKRAEAPPPGDSPHTSPQSDRAGP